MSMLSQDAQRRIVSLLSAPLPEWAAIAEAWERGARVESRYRGTSLWRECERGGLDYTFTPNWQHWGIEFRIIGGSHE